MLSELRVENLLLVERAELRVSPGLNVLTGETGAGKTMLATALDLLLGGKAKAGLVRPGAAEAYVEGVFGLPADLPEETRERIPSDAEELVVARRVWPDGRTRAYLNGRSATLPELRELGGRLLSFYGQHESRKLMLAAVQLEILDRFIGARADALRAEVGPLHAQVRELEAEKTGLEEAAGALEREVDLLRYELAEIEAAAPEPEELETLTVRRDRLRHAETLQTAAAAAAHALGGEGAAAEQLARALPALESAAGHDQALMGAVERLRGLRLEAEDLAGELQGYALESEVMPGELEGVEERLSLLSRLARKYGGATADVIGHAEQCRTRLESLENASGRLDTLDGELSLARAELEAAAASLSEVRRERAPALAEAVRGRLRDLAMAEAVFEVLVTPRAGGCGARGADTVELMIAPNPGMPAGPLRDIASGGEMSRVMLALLGVAHGDAGVAARGRRGSGAETPAQPMLVFDEIDAGIGGLTARAVGAQLRQLAQGRQVLCITHLPQVAAVAQRHFTIVKDSSGDAAVTRVRALEGDGVVDELVRMLGAGTDDRAASEHARALLRAA